MREDGCSFSDNETRTFSSTLGVMRTRLLSSAFDCQCSDSVLWIKPIIRYAWDMNSTCYKGFYQTHWGICIGPVFDHLMLYALITISYNCCVYAK